ncbi:MAG: hypothetical protein FJW40_17605 [Acidobacteria bacterium]|nr:hypothetical protein [Acidobacteriota bacterium]
MSEEAKSWIEVQAEEKTWIDRLRDSRGIKESDPTVGLAFSGGGIRSATLNLGILQALQSLGLLKYVQYLSTVSGGGYIGGWLVTNYFRRCKDTRDVEKAEFLTRERDQPDGPEKGYAVRHLRQYSRYLAPRTGFFSADTWSIATIWIRNTLLIQMAVVLAIALVLTGGHGIHPLSDWLAGTHETGAAAGAVFLTLGLILAVANAGPKSRLGQGGVVGIASLIFFSSLALASAAKWWAVEGPASRTPLFVAGGLFFFMGLSGGWVARKPAAGLRAAIMIGAAGAAGCAFILAAAAYVEGQCCWMPKPWWPLLGPPLVTLTLCGILTLHIGAMGRDMDDLRREWWSRFTAWLTVLSFSYSVLGIAAVPGPYWLIQGWQSLSAAIQSAGAAGILGLIGTAIVSGKSDKTDGNSGGVMSLVADYGAYAFIALLILSVGLGVSTAVERFSPWPVLIVISALGTFAWLCFDLNEFSMNPFYRNRLVRAFLGASLKAEERARSQPFTGFNADVDVRIADLAADLGDESYKGPYPIINTALNRGGDSDLDVQERQAQNFIFTPLYCGTADPHGGSQDAFRPTREYRKNTFYGTAIAISGAAASPNMGFNTSPAVAFLMTMFNVRLGWWVPNPAMDAWKKKAPHFQLRYLVKEMAGAAGAGSKHVYLSDGGHFENLAVYELLRRRCRFIIACDGEQDANLTFESLAGLIRKAWIDFQIIVRIDVNGIGQRDSNGLSRSHCAVGRILYPEGDEGVLLYIKSSVTGDEPADIMQYRASSPTFPHESTGDQFFSENQFESYRNLGFHIGRTTMQAAVDECQHHGAIDWSQFMVALRQRWMAPAAGSADFTRHTEALKKFWERIGSDPKLAFLDPEFFPEWQQIVPGAGSTKGVTGDLPADPVVFRKAFYLSQELLQLMEDVYIDLKLEDFSSHPDNRGWMNLFKHWTWHPPSALPGPCPAAPTARGFRCSPKTPSGSMSQPSLWKRAKRA